MRTHVVIKQSLLETVNIRSSLLSKLLETNPDENGTADMIALNTSEAALALLNTRNLLGLTVKLLNLPTQGTHLSRALSGVLSDIIRCDEVRALGGEHQSEEFHPMTFGKILDVDELAVLLLMSRPLQSVKALIGLLPVGFIDQPISLERAIIELAQIFNVHHQLALGIPSVHQHASERKLLVGVGIVQHLADMIQLAFAIPIGVINPVVDDPEFVRVGIDINAGHHANAFDDPVCIATVLSPHQFNLERRVFVQHRVVEGYLASWAGDDLLPHILPYQPRRDFLAFQIPFHCIMAELLAVLGKVRERVIGLRHQQKLTIVQSGYCAHAF